MSSYCGHGPKDWRPDTSFRRSTLLSKEEQDRIRNLESEYRRSFRSGPFGSEDVLWLASVARRLAVLNPDEFDFPRSMAFVNQIACNAFFMLHMRSEPMKRTVKVAGPEFQSGQDLLDITLECPPAEAVAIVRPYVRLLPNTPDGLKEQFRRSSVSMVHDGFAVLKADEIDAHLIGADGRGVRRPPFSFSRRSIDGSIFLANEVDSEGNAYCDARIGLFGSNGCRILLRLDACPHPLDGEIEAVAGIVAARYKYKGILDAPPQGIHQH